MSKFSGKFDIVSTDLRIILLNFVVTDVYALFNESTKKLLQKGRGGSTALLKKTADLVRDGTPYHVTYLACQLFSRAVEIV